MDHPAGPRAAPEPCDPGRFIAGCECEKCAEYGTTDWAHMPDALRDLASLLVEEPRG